MLVWKFALSLFLSSLKIAHIKEHLWAIRSRRSLKKSDCEQIALDFFRKCEVSNSLVIWANRSKQWVICSKKHIFVCFWQFSPLFNPKVICSHCSSLSHSLQKSNRERFAPFPHDKRAMGAIGSFSRANCSFAHKKQAICLKNWWANFQPWIHV